MELILIGNNLREYGILDPTTFECEVGEGNASNTFEITGYDPLNGGVYIPGTEYGGFIERIKTQTDVDSITYEGWTWRGLLSQAVLSPPSGADYYTDSGDLHAVMRRIVGTRFGSLFDVPEWDAGFSVSFQAERYCTYLKALTDLCLENGFKLVIRAKKSDTVHVILSAEPIITVSGSYNEDSRLQLQFTENRMGINHLICLGKGELKDRQKVDLFIDQAGKISESQYFRGLWERTATFDYGNAESLDELKKAGKEKLKELAGGSVLQINAIQDVEMDIGDIVTGSHLDSGITTSAPIDRKILRYSDGDLKIEYHVKEAK